ncbi:error-prone DNA polymerase [Sphingobacterium paludis]|uniref:DNA polymerase III subunit alpha n=1 Tax=Sphingobacterium paludis TaxID=1476465 RepID=A0A4R7CXI5_9SPHI|nr:error-prone DNA polymerase [Sphingobacterium paludis]TDS13249.1 error-prone DNA polymerase [Sphingobacterium paludis]
MGYIELNVSTNFSFLRGASHPDELMQKAHDLHYQALGVTDRNTLAGIVRAHVAAKKHGLRLVVGCRLDLLDGVSLLAYPRNRNGYAQLCALLSVGNQRAEKGKCHLYKADVLALKEDLLFILVPPAQLTESFKLENNYTDDLYWYAERLKNQFYIGISRLYSGDDQKRLFRLHEQAMELSLPLVVVGEVHYHEPDRRELCDVLTCIREKCTIHTAGYRLHANAERYLKPGEEMERLFRNYPEALENTVKLAEACRFSLDELTYQYPEELTSDGRTPQEELEMLVWEGAGEKLSPENFIKYRPQIQMELDFIQRKNYPSYFLTVYDYVKFARDRGILCQGRGSAANSIVCYCLGITSVDPTKIKLLFARFMSDARDEPPDIDVDFEHERREEVIQYIYEKYGRERAAIVATVTQERPKGALRDVGKAMGLSMDALSRLSQTISSHWDSEIDAARFAEHGFSTEDAHFRKIIELSEQLLGFPRQLGQHTGGFVITQGKMHELCPVINARMENRTNIEWNKDDLEALGFLKVDVLGLGMLTCIRKAFDLVKKHYGKELTLANIPQDDSRVYDMICEADTLGVFQIESRAQMSMLPRLRPREFYDLVIEVAIVRPGPIQGDMVHPYLRRRNGEEPEDYPSEEIRDILRRTKGVPLFQEQAMEIAIVAAGFTPAEADGLRRSMATFKSKGEVRLFREKMIKGMLEKGYAEEFAQRVFRQLEGFGSYGFPESHAASFALLVYVSCYIKCYYPDVFAAALLNSQPMGFYHPAQIVIDAQKHGVQVNATDINFSQWDNTLEGNFGEKFHKLRLGFRQIKGVNEMEIAQMIAHRKAPYTRIEDLADIVSLSLLEKLADADAFRSLGFDRRQALWQVAALGDRPIQMFKEQPSASALEMQMELPLMTASEHVVQDYATTGLSVKAHPVSFLRTKLDKKHVVPTDKLSKVKNGMPVRVCGLITVRQRPGTAKGVLFVTIEDEVGFANLVVWGKVFERYRREILQAKLLLVNGVVQIEGKVIHVVVKQCYNLNDWLQDLQQAEESQTPGVFHKGRNFR